MEFESLVPNVDVENKKNKNKNKIKNKPFLDAMKWAIDNNENKNIAITGSYGAGKSSLIDSFIKQEEIEDKTVKISIATFKKDKIQDATDNKSSDTDIPLENILEQQILQQLFYKIEPDKIPFSKFTRIFDLDKYKTLSLIFYILIMSLITYSMFKFNWLPKAYSKFTSGDLNYAVMIAILGIFFLLTYTYAIYICILIFQKLGLSKFGFGSTSIEVVTKDNNTVFNRYLDEIIYFFKQSKYQYVIFEDLDRFENIGIYERLKGLNIILNNTKQLSEQNIIFIYALKDDLFINNDGTHEIYNRTKFFDFIIPTVKIVHTSNAENLLIERLEGEFQSEKNLIGLTKDFIEDIALYVNDMRILKNICNEYKIYKDALANNGITANRLFAFIVYKNIYPGDYSSILSNKGKVYEVLNSKDLIINKIKMKIETIQKQIDFGTISETYNLEEIETLFYLDKTDLEYYTQIDICEQNGQLVRSIEAESYPYSISNIRFKDLFETCVNIQENFILRLYRTHYGVQTYGKDFFNESGKINYLDRYKAVKSNEESNSLLGKIRRLEVKLKKVKNNSLSYLIRFNYIESEMLNKLKEEDDLLYFLIRNGWVDESYEDYLSYFYEGSLSQNDNKFLKAIRNGLVENENLKLKNIRRVLERIKLEEISHRSVFNYDLLEYLIENREENANKFIKMVKLLFSNDESKEYYLRFVEFISEKNKFNVLSVLISQANTLDFKIWDEIIVNLDSKRKEKYAYSIINSWLFINDKNPLKLMKDFIEQLEPQKIYDNCNLEEIQQMLEDLEIKFKDITSLDEERRDYVAKHNCFEIILMNIKHLIEEVNIKNALDNELINKYIKKNIKEFIESVILGLDSYIEDEETLISFLNDEELDERLKYELIKKCNNRIEDISKLDSVNDLISLDKMQCNIYNITSLINHDEYEEGVVSLNKVLSKKPNWNELLGHKNELKQITESAFDKISVELLKLDLVNGYEMNNLFEDTGRYITVPHDLLESTDENLYDKLSSLINLLDWDIGVYRFISKYEDKELLLKYLLDSLKECEYDDIKDDLLHLNSEGLLPWSEELIGKLKFNDKERITYFKHLSRKVPEQFVLHRRV